MARRISDIIYAIIRDGTEEPKEAQGKITSLVLPPDTIGEEKIKEV